MVKFATKKVGVGPGLAGMAPPLLVWNLRWTFVVIN